MPELNQNSLLRSIPILLTKAGIGAFKATIKLLTINVPSYVVYFGADEHKIPDNQVGKIANLLKAAFAMHSISSVGSELFPKHSLIFDVLGCGVQSYLNNNHFLPGALRAASYEFFGFSYPAVMVSESIYGASASLLTGVNRGDFSVAHIYDSVHKSAEASNYLYASVQAVHLPIVNMQQPDLFYGALFIDFLSQVNFSNLYDNSDAGGMHEYNVAE